MAFPDRLTSYRGHRSGRPASGQVYRAVVEITNRCNLRCTMCPRNGMTRKVGHMDPDLFASIIDDNRSSLEYVSLNGYGEPLLSPHLSRFLDHCRKRGVATGLSTNCTLLTDENIELLVATPPNHIILAVDGTSRESYERIRVGARYDEVVANVKRFLRRCAGLSRRPTIVLQCIYMTETKDEVRQFKTFFSGYDYDAIRIRQLTYSGKNRTDADYTNRSCSCYWLWNEPMILYDGTVVPCCQDVNGVLALGEVGRTALASLWNHGRIETLRKMHAAGARDALEVCEGCNMYQPGALLSLGAALVKTSCLNTVLPRVETEISRLRYRG